jgi:D-alanyl-D-alanine carboxypeptidase
MTMTTVARPHHSHIFALTPVLVVGVVLGFGLLGSSGSYAAQPDESFSAKLRVQLLAKMKETATPGALVYVDGPGVKPLTFKLGVADLQMGIPMEADDHMRIGSVTKTFTAGTILRFVDQRKLSLDDPVSQYEPEVPNGSNITIRELLNMTSGLFDYQEDPAFVKAGSDEPDFVFEPKDLLKIAVAHPPYFPPGAGFHYSNTNTVLLGLIIQMVGGQTVADAYQQQLFGPLGLRYSSMPERQSGTIPAVHPRGYYYSSEKLYAARGAPVDVTTWNPSWGWTAGAAISTLNDMAAWAKALGTGQLLSPATFAQQRQFVKVPGSTAEYGLGMFKVDGYLGHNGSIPGFTSFVGYDPVHHRTVIVLTNLALSTGLSPADQLAQIARDALAAAP